MKHRSTLLGILATVLVSCGPDGKHFAIDGHLLNLNGGEFFVYSPDGAMSGLDTITVRGGRFGYEIPADEEGTLVIVFPNFSEVPVFVKPGKQVSVKGDASHLKELAIKGTKDNELMTALRNQMKSASPQEEQRLAETFINEHPRSMASAYVLMKWFVQTATPDYKKASLLASTLIKAQPRNGLLKRLQKGIDGRNATTEGSQLPAFTARDMNGNSVTAAALKAADVAVINVWASWNYESVALQNELQRLQKKHSQLKLVGINVDASREMARRTLKRDSIRWHNICDEQMLESPLLHTLGLSAVPDNIVLKSGKIVAHGLRQAPLREKVEQLLKK